MNNENKALLGDVKNKLAKALYLCPADKHTNVIVKELIEETFQKVQAILTREQEENERISG